VRALKKHLQRGIWRSLNSSLKAALISRQVVLNLLARYAMALRWALFYTLATA
jgi:hypothetical protein